MEFIVISIFAILLGVGSGVALSKAHDRNTRLMIWGIVTIFLFSWAIVTFIGGIYTVMIQKATAIMSFWLYGVPSLIVVGLAMFFIGLFYKVRKMIF